MTTPQPYDEGQPKGMTYIQHGWEKCKQQPLVPIGAAATTVALLGATASLKSGNRASFQKFLRLRVAAQGLTVVAMVVGAYMLSDKAEEVHEARLRARAGITPDAPAPAPQPNETDQFYPTRTKTKVSDFTRRLREAEELQKTDDKV